MNNCNKGDCHENQHSGCLPASPRSVNNAFAERRMKAGPSGVFSFPFLRQREGAKCGVWGWQAQSCWGERGLAGTASAVFSEAGVPHELLRGHSPVTSC